MELTRNEVIETLTNIDKAYRTFTPKELHALDYAINSLKTDEMYQLDYEGGEIFTKADMVAMLEEIQLEIEELQGKYSPYYDEASQHTNKVIQQKIDKLKGNQG